MRSITSWRVMIAIGSSLAPHRSHSAGSIPIVRRINSAHGTYEVDGRQDRKEGDGVHGCGIGLGTAATAAPDGSGLGLGGGVVLRNRPSVSPWFLPLSGPEALLFASCAQKPGRVVSRSGTMSERSGEPAESTPW